MKECLDCENLHKRIRRIIGQLNAIDKMVDGDVPCEEILIQISAVKSAVHKTGQAVLEGHLANCVREGVEAGDPEKIIDDCSKIMEYFSRMS